VHILLLSDIHANLEALEACLDAAPPYDLAINLGDVVGYGATPNEIIAHCRRVCRYHVRGNHDKACAGGTNVEGFNPIAAQAALWTRTALQQTNLEWLRDLPAGPLSVDELPGMEFVHGSPFDEDEYLVAVTDAMEVLFSRRAPLTFFGHTHIQGGFFLNRERGGELHTQIGLGNTWETRELQLDPDAHYLINPGSVGQPRDGDWRAGFAWFDNDSRTIRFYRVPYDVQSAQRRIREAALPERLAARLSIGR
jgi:diadenosine tetraphosphatase ApaH/serine/threonine PP2A family protein phosphatase